MLPRLAARQLTRFHQRADHPCFFLQFLSLNLRSIVLAQCLTLLECVVNVCLCMCLCVCLQDIVSALEERLRPLVQAELSVLVDVLHRPELLFPEHTEAHRKCESGGFICKYDELLLSLQYLQYNNIQNTIIKYSITYYSFIPINDTILCCHCLYV